MKVKRHGVSGALVMFLCVLSGFVLVVMVVHSDAPGIMRDWEISKNPTILRQAKVSNGKCKTRQGFITTCKVGVLFGERGKQKRKQLEFTFVDFHTGDYSVEVIASADKPEMVSLDLAVDKLWNRIIVACLLLLAGLTFIIVEIIAMAKATATRRAFRAFNNKVLIPVPVEISKLSKNYGMHTAEYSYDFKGRKRKLTTALRRQTPFFLSHRQDEKTALGVTDQYGEYVILMDEALTRLDFTDTERQAIRNAREAMNS